MMSAERRSSDVFSAEKRSSVMRSIGRRDTRPEMQLRRLLSANGFRYRLKLADLPFSPDIVFPSARLAVFVHGCFWHGHACHLFRWPRSNAAFWRAKIERNVQRDLRAERELLDFGWRSLTVWECSFRGRYRLELSALVSAVRRVLNDPDMLISHIPHGYRANFLPIVDRLAT
jgi:DNA mismatch endonuclease (patch repair protein)